MAGSIPGPADDLVTRHNELERRVRNLETSPSLQSATVPTGTTTFSGGTLIIDGGDLVLKDVGGTILFRIGAQVNGDRGLSVSRIDGTVALEVRKAFAPTDAKQIIRLLDSTGHPMLAEAVLSFTGIDAPAVPMLWRPVDRSDAKSTTSATFVSLFRHQGVMQNPYITPKFSVICSDGTTAGQIQVIDANTGSVLVGFFNPAWVGTIPAGTTADTTFIPTYPLNVPGNMGDAIKLEVQVKVTAGTGNISVAVIKSIG